MKTRSPGKLFLITEIVNNNYHIYIGFAQLMKQLLKFLRSTNADSPPLRAHPDLVLEFKYCEKFVQRGHARSFGQPRTDISVILQKCCSELDVSIVDRITALLNPQPLCKRNPNKFSGDKHSMNQQSCFYQAVENSSLPVSKLCIKISSPLLIMKLRFPTPDLRPIHDMDRPPWWKRSVRRDFLTFELTDVSFQTLVDSRESSRRYEVQCRDIYGLFQEADTDSFIPFIRTSVDDKNGNSLPDGGQGFGWPRIVVHIHPVNTRCDLDEMTEMDVQEPLKYSMSESLANAGQQEPSPFSSKKSIHKSDTPHTQIPQVTTNYFLHREFSLTLAEDIYIRYRSFANQDELEAEIQKRNPHKIDIGAVYSSRPKDHLTTNKFIPLEKELVFDIDMTDYDDVRTCCSGADVCRKCWRFMSVACKVLDASLREDFGFEHLLWVFSGRRGVHCWVCDEAARKLDISARSAVAEYLQIVTGGVNQAKKVNLPGDKLHHSVKRAKNFVEQQFLNIVEEQDILGSPESIAKVLALISDSELKQDLEKEIQRHTSSQERWNALVAHVRMLQDRGQLKRRHHFLLEEIMLQYTYPRLDINVTKGLNHLLKSPFCVHPKTGKVCIPFNPRSADKFNPSSVPTISQLVDEVSDFDAKIEEQILDAKTKRVKDYKKTKMNKGIMVFEEFLKKLENTWKGKKIELSDRNDDICGNYNGRRLYLGLGERGFLTAKNITSQLYSRLQFSDDNISSHEKCNLEIVTCPSCVISVTFRHLNLSHHCGGGNVVMDSPCRCDLVWLSEPSYEDVSKMPFCGLYSPLMTNNIVNILTYRSLTRTLAVALMFSESHQHAFTLEYSSERNGSNSGILKSPYFPASYPRDLDTEYVITCQPETSSNCRVRVLFQDFQIATGSIMEVRHLTSSEGLAPLHESPALTEGGPNSSRPRKLAKASFLMITGPMAGTGLLVPKLPTARVMCVDMLKEHLHDGLEWAIDAHDRRWYSHTPNYYFPKIAPYPDLKTATLVFLVTSSGLILLISAMIVLLYRLGARARQQRELQNQLRSISEMLDGALHDDQPPDDPPIYEAPPDYNEVIKVFIDPIESQRRKRKRQLHHKNGSRRSQSTPRKALRNASPSGSDHIPSTQTFLEVPQMSTDTSDDYATISTCGLLEVERNIVHLQPYNNIMSRSCQTTPIPDSPPPPYVASLCPVSMDLGCFGRVRSEDVREPVVVPLCKILMNAKDQAILADMYVVSQWDCCQLYNTRR
uniref:DNA primase n=1 Tax=Timema bartmani TaxID=61472 RepID=A0A7R9EUK8_9NEOP|nr:unnamed protein product [Timema bartmani]